VVGANGSISFGWEKHHPVTVCMLLLHYPYFRDRKARAQSEGETEFLSKLAYRESNPPLRSKVRYSGLYMLFGILELGKHPVRVFTYTGQPIDSLLDGYDLATVAKK
jgi:hypothetical protein